MDHIAELMKSLPALPENTLQPLDMVWQRAEGHITRVRHRGVTKDNPG